MFLFPYVVGSRRSVAYQFYFDNPELDPMAHATGPRVGGHVMSTNWSIRYLSALEGKRPQIQYHSCEV